MKKILLTAAWAMLGITSGMAAEQYDYMPDDGMAVIQHDQKAILREAPFIRDTFKVRFDGDHGLVDVLPGTMAASSDKVANGVRYVRYEYPELYYPKTTDTTTQVYLDIQKEPYASTNATTAPLEKEFQSETVDVNGTPYVIRMASSTAYPRTSKDYFPLVMKAATASLDAFDVSKPYYPQGQVPWNLMEPIQGEWGTSAYKTVLKVKDYKINGNPVEAIYNVSQDADALSMDVITINREHVGRYHLVLKEEPSSVMTREKVLYVNGERTTQSKGFNFAMGIGR